MFGNFWVRQSCALASTTVAAPTILSNDASQDFRTLLASSPTYVISQFTLTNTNCPLQSIEIVPVSGGSSLDYTASDSTSLVLLLTDQNDADIQVSLPLSTQLEWTYLFRIKATAKGGAVAYTNDIKVKLVDC